MPTYVEYELEGGLTILIEAPGELMEACVRERGNRPGLFPLNEALERWLKERLSG